MRSTPIRGIYERNGAKIIDKVVDGVRVYENCGPVSLKFAEQVLSKKTAAVLEGRYFPEKQIRSLTVTAALNTYWSDKLQHLASAKNARYLLSRIDQMLGPIPLKNLTIAHVEKYKRDRAGQKTRYGTPIKPRTIQAELDQLNLALNWMRKNRYILANPIAGFEKVEQSRPKKIHLDEGREDGNEWQRLYNAAGDDLKPVIVTLYETGMRPSEVFQMRWGWIDFIRRVIRIPAEAEKTRDGRTVPVSEKLYALLCSLPQTGGLVFPSPAGEGRRGSIKKAFDGAVRRSGLTGRGITPYALRRTRLTIWDAKDPAAAMAAGDHTQSSTHYDHYVTITDDRLLRLVG